MSKFQVPSLFAWRLMRPVLCPSVNARNMGGCVLEKVAVHALTDREVWILNRVNVITHTVQGIPNVEEDAYLKALPSKLTALPRGNHC